MIKLKICGLSRMQDIDAVNALLPEYIGFVFAESRRRVEEETAEALAARTDSRILKTGVFVNEDPEKILRLCRNGVIDLVQLHGDENREYLLFLKEKLPNPVIKAVRVRTAAEILEADSLPCDFLLLDTYAKGQYGGSGAAFDWNVIPALQKPYFLAGGLYCDNVLQAVSACKPYALDISSGVETDGVKDPEKIRNIIQLIRSEQ